MQSWVDNDETIHDDADDDPVGQSVAMETDSMDGESDSGGGSAGKGVGRKHAFYQRTDSTTFLGCVPPDPFHVPMVDAIPLAERPQLLLPNARKEELFGVPKHSLADVASSAAADKSPFLPTPTPFDRLPIHLALSTRVAGLTRGYSAATTAATEAPACSQVAPLHTDSHAAQPTTNATVIVRPSAQVAAAATDGNKSAATNSDSGAATTVAPSSGGSTEHATKPVAVPSTATPAPSTVAATAEPGTHDVEIEKPCTQASVIVHASAAQSMALHPTGASQKPTASAPEGVKAEGGGEESKEPSAAPASTATVR